ncbi:MAG: hypothetical protein ACRDK7_02720 [Solirubrobacteraceae bacterium]
MGTLACHLLSQIINPVFLRHPKLSNEFLKPARHRRQPHRGSTTLRGRQPIHRPRTRTSLRSNQTTILVKISSSDQFIHTSLDRARLIGLVIRCWASPGRLNFRYPNPMRRLRFTATLSNPFPSSIRGNPDRATRLSQRKTLHHRRDNARRENVKL